MDPSISASLKISLPLIEENEVAGGEGSGRRWKVSGGGGNSVAILSQRWWDPKVSGGGGKILQNLILRSRLCVAGFNDLYRRCRFEKHFGGAGL